jgi:hypothetical protein
MAWITKDMKFHEGGPASCMAVVCKYAVEMIKGRLAKHSCFVAGSRRAIWIRLFITDSPIPLIPIRTTFLLIE